MSATLPIQIHLMLLLIALHHHIRHSIVDSNTSHVTINQNKFCTKFVFAIFKYISCYY